MPIDFWIVAPLRHVRSRRVDQYSSLFAKPLYLAILSIIISTVRIVSCLLLLAFCLECRGQTLKGVFGSNVKKGAEALEYRFGYTGDRGNGAGAFAQRFHYQKAVSDKLQFRGIAFFRDLHGERPDFQAFRLESLYQLKENSGDGFMSALRFDIHLADGAGSPGYLRLGWGTQFNVSNKVTFRTNLLARTGLGENSNSKIRGEFRWQGNYSIGNGWSTGLELYSSMGAVDDLGSFNDQDHLLGPYLKGPMGKRLKWQIQNLLGLSDSSIDTQWRVFLSLPL